VPEARLSLHQDRDERDFASPIVSVSLGMSAVFLFGGLTRAQRPARVLLEHGDVVVWGGVDRLRFHGVLPLKEEPGNLFAVSRHPMLLGQRINLTFRKAG
jgi:alkylated DNA repair protein (DNA oxidative demethylase)